jgi:hypothetical protein
VCVICGVDIDGVTNLKAKHKNWLEDSPWDSEQQLMEDLITVWEDMKSFGIEKGVLTKRSDGSIVGRGHPDRWFDKVEKTVNVNNS